MYSIIIYKYTNYDIFQSSINHHTIAFYVYAQTSIFKHTYFKFVFLELKVAALLLSGLVKNTK